MNLRISDAFRPASVILLALLASCVAGRQGNVSPKHTIRIAFSVEPSTLNPLLMRTQAESLIESAVFDGLLGFDADGKLIPDAAVVVPSIKNGGISPDGLTIVYRLRPDVKWTDGTPLTAADVVFTYNLLKNPKTNSSFGYRYKNVRRMIALDDHTVQVSLKSRFTDSVEQIFVNGRGGGAILPKHVLAHAADINTAPFNANPIGSGPYRIAVWSRGDMLLLAPNPQSYLSSRGAPTLRVDFVPDFNTSALRVQTKEDEIGIVSPDMQFPDIGRTARIVAQRSRHIVYISLNVRGAVFRDVRLRRALGLAIDRASLVSNVYHGRVELADSLLPSGDFGYSGNRKYRGDMNSAASLLRSAGYSKNHRLAVTLLYGSGVPAYEKMAVLLQNRWSRIGIDAAVKPQPPNLLYSPTGPIDSGKYDAALVGYTFSDAIPDRRQFLDSESFPPGGYNQAFYTNATVSAEERHAEATTNSAARLALYADVQRQLDRDIPYIPLAWPADTYIVSRRVKGFDPGKFANFLWNASRWEIQAR